MRFRGGRYYEHKSMLDYCIFVQKCMYEDMKRIKLKISWYLRRSMASTGITETITIKRENFLDWSEIWNTEN